MTAEVATDTVNKATEVARNIVIARQLEQHLQGLLDGLAMQIKAFPAAADSLRELVSPWIHEAVVDLHMFRKTGDFTPVDVEPATDRAKRRYWAELVVIGQVYPGLPINEMHDYMCARVDSVYVQHLQNMAVERRDHLDRMSGIRHATLGHHFGEIDQEEFARNVIEQV